MWDHVLLHLFEPLHSYYLVFSFSAYVAGHHPVDVLGRLQSMVLEESLQLTFWLLSVHSWCVRWRLEVLLLRTFSLHSCLTLSRFCPTFPLFSLLYLLGVNSMWLALQLIPELSSSTKALLSHSFSVLQQLQFSQCQRSLHSLISTDILAG